MSEYCVERQPSQNSEIMATCAGEGRGDFQAAKSRQFLHGSVRLTFFSTFALATIVARELKHRSKGTVARTTVRSIAARIQFTKPLLEA